jgi:hypothetical protein
MLDLNPVALRRRPATIRFPLPPARWVRGPARQSPDLARNPRTSSPLRLACGSSPPRPGMPKTRGPGIEATSRILG